MQCVCVYCKYFIYVYFPGQIGIPVCTSVHKSPRCSYMCEYAVTDSSTPNIINFLTRCLHKFSLVVCAENCTEKLLHSANYPRTLSSYLDASHVQLHNRGLSRRFIEMLNKVMYCAGEAPACDSANAANTKPSKLPRLLGVRARSHSTRCAFIFVTKTFGLQFLSFPPHGLFHVAYQKETV